MVFEAKFRLSPNNDQMMTKDPGICGVLILPLSCPRLTMIEFTLLRGLGSE